MVGKNTMGPTTKIMSIWYIFFLKDTPIFFWTKKWKLKKKEIWISKKVKVH